MFEEFSSGYYLGRLYVQPYGGDRAVIHADQHQEVEHRVYERDEGDLPLVMKLGTRHFPVHGEGAVPADTLAVPERVLDDAARHGYEREEVLLARGPHARRLLDMGAV